MSHRKLAQLVKRLTSYLGPDHATNELRWLRQSFNGNLDAIPSLIRRRLNGEPLQYILGTQPFGPLNMLIRPPVLIPRPETEHWTLQLAGYVQPSAQQSLALMDLGTGSGCIPLLLCHLWPAGSVHAYAVDVNPDAITLAFDNARQCGISTDQNYLKDQPCNIFTPFCADILHPTFLETLQSKGPFHIITSNPPYITKSEYDLLPSSVRDFEDPRALLGDYPERGSDGLLFYHAIARLVKHDGVLTGDGKVVLEVGDGQATAVQQIMQTEGGFAKTSVWLDPWGKQRVVLASKMSPSG